MMPRPLTTKDKAAIERFIAANLKKAAEHGKNADALGQEQLKEIIKMQEYTQLAADVATRYKANMKPKLELVKDETNT